MGFKTKAGFSQLVESWTAERKIARTAFVICERDFVAKFSVFSIFLPALNTTSVLLTARFQIQSSYSLIIPQLILCNASNFELLIPILVISLINN